MRKNPYLRLISDNETIAIPATDGRATIAMASDVFPGWIDHNFRKSEMKVRSDPTRATRVSIFEIAYSGRFEEIFQCFDRALKSLCLTQAQIVEFCRIHKQYLAGNGYGTFFLLNASDGFIIPGTYRGLERRAKRKICAYPMNDTFLWKAIGHRRFVVPQI